MVILLLFSIIAQAILKYSKADVARGLLCFKFQSCWVWIDGVVLDLVKCSLLLLSGFVMFSIPTAGPEPALKPQTPAVVSITGRIPFWNSLRLSHPVNRWIWGCLLLNLNLVYTLWIFWGAAPRNCWSFVAVFVRAVYVCLVRPVTLLQSTPLNIHHNMHSLRVYRTAVYRTLYWAFLG